MTAHRIAIIGAVEPKFGDPFTGSNLYRLDQTLAEVGIRREDCFIGYVGSADVAEHLEAYHPQFILLLGDTALRAFKGPASVENWRGSLFAATFVVPGVKCMATFHPARTRVDAETGPVFRFDLQRMARETQTDTLDIPHRNIYVDQDLRETLWWLGQACRCRKPLAIDIEGGVTDISCIGFASSPTQAIVVPFSRKDGSSIWSEDDETTLWIAIADLLEDPLVPKILQNSLYDCFVLAWTLGITVRGITDDTMLKHHELYCELPKDLGFQCSIYTRQPFYKGDRKSNDDTTFFNYCGMDCCITYECHLAQDRKLTPAQRKHYQFNLSLLPAVLFMELRGIRYDVKAARRALANVQRWMYTVQDLINTWGGKPFPTNDTDMFQLVRDQLCLKQPRLIRYENKTRNFKNGRSKTTTKRISEKVDLNTWGDLESYCKPACKDTLQQVQGILGKRRSPSSMGRAMRGQLSILLDSRLKTGATGRSRTAHTDEEGFVEEKDANKTLYETWGFPRQTNEAGNLTSRSEAILAILMKLPKEDKVGRSRAKAFLLLRSLQTQANVLKAGADRDGRIRTSLNLVGTETDRFSASKSPTRSGYNLQTVTKRHRFLFSADPDHLMIQADLRGADGWTIAANSAQQGDSTMWDDCQAGIKPAKVIALLHTHGPSLNQLDRQTLKERCREVDSDGWLYAACKAVYYGSSYGMQPKKMSETLLDDSFKKEGTPILVPPDVCRDLQERGYFLRYPGVRRWQQECLRKLQSTGQLSCSNGFTRRFYGRKDNAKTHRDFMSTEPQVMTTWATKLALWSLWTDPENRMANGSLVIEPLLTVHDSLILQTQLVDREWAAKKVPEWFNNVVVIAGQPLVIPPDIGCGPNWKLTTDPL